jgi:glycosyltransferase involved in cell wall biosynthesis
MSRPHLLFLSHCLPYPPDSGVTIRTLNVLKQLQKEFDVTVLMFSRRNHQPDRGGRERAWRTLQGMGFDAFEPIPIASERSRARMIWDQARSVITGRAYTFYQYQSTAFQRQLRAALSQRRPAVIHVDSIDLHGALGDLPSRPLACTHHDIESHALRQRAARATGAVLRTYIRHQAALVEHTERALCPTFAANLVMSELDGQRLTAIAPDAKVVVAPNGVDTSFFTPSRNGAAPTGRVLFVGHTSFQPNRDAVEFFLTSIWPQVRARQPGATFHLIGRGTRADRASVAAHPAVTPHDYVPDIRPHFAEADCSVVPIRFGGGTRIKILDAWAMGIAVVSTSVGCEGLRAVDGENILVRDTPAAFADGVTEILTNAELRSRLGENGRRTVEEFYSWDRVGAGIRELYFQLI